MVQRFSSSGDATSASVFASKGAAETLFADETSSKITPQIDRESESAALENREIEPHNVKCDDTKRDDTKRDDAKRDNAKRDDAKRDARASAPRNERRNAERDAQLPRTTPEPQPPDAELIVAVFRTVVILAALLVPRFAALASGNMPRDTNIDAPLLWLASFAGAYNFAIIFAYVRQGRRALRRPFIIAMDATLITLWIQLSFDWGLFPLYYVVVIVAAVWYRTAGGIFTAFCCNFFFLLILGRAATYSRQDSLQLAPVAPPSIDVGEAFHTLVKSPFFGTGFALDVAMLFMVGALVGTLAQAQERERVRRLEEQLLLASYQREIDLASQLQPLLMPQWNMAFDAESATSSTRSAPAPTQWATEGQIDAPERISMSGSTRSGSSRRTRDEEASPQNARLQNSDLRLGAAMQPAREFGGGDYFDLLPLPGGRSALCIADVSGKSVRAQARLPLLKYALRALAPLYNEADTLVQRLNETLSPDLQGEIYIGLCIIVLDPRANKLSWCNAGHIAPILLPIRPYDERGRAVPDMLRLETSGPALGLFADADYKASSALWRPGDRLLLFTDGLSDALSYNGAEDGEEQVRFNAGELDHERWREPQVVAQHFLHLALEAMENTETLWSKLSPLRRGDDPVVRAPSRHRDDMTIVAARRLLPNER